MFDFSVLRELRKREGLTLEALAKRSGVSVAVISKLERNQSRAELETLFRLARAFGISATELLGLTESRLVTPTEATRYRSGDFTFERIRYSNMDGFRGHARAGATLSRAEIHRDDYEVCWVTRGRVRLGLPRQSFELAGGEAVQFDAVEPHTYEALSDCELILLHLRKPNRF
jgi:transcriptional regulator with XRE-family HTH domain